MLMISIILIFAGSIFSLEMKTTKKCDGTNYLLVVVINFQCSVGAGVVRSSFFLPFIKCAM